MTPYDQLRRYKRRRMVCQGGDKLGCPLLNIAAVIEENGVRLRLNIVDTPGYGDLVNNDRW